MLLFCTFYLSVNPGKKKYHGFHKNMIILITIINVSEASNQNLRVSSEDSENSALHNTFYISKWIKIENSYFKL